jgi:hypothetical protein
MNSFRKTKNMLPTLILKRSRKAKKIDYIDFELLPTKQKIGLGSTPLI